MLNTLIIGDVVGKPALNFLIETLPALKETHAIDFIIVNGENATNGKGLSGDMANALKNAGVHVITSGNHIWQGRTRDVVVKHHGFVLRPINYPKSNMGVGSTVVEVKGQKIAVINAIGRTFMPDQVDSPFEVVKTEIDKLREQTTTIIVDFHGEATAEKIAFGRFLDGSVSCVVGTHTHVQTADEQIFPNGTAYITDLGMSGPINSVIGMKTEPAMLRFKLGTPTRYELAEGDLQICGVVVKINEETGKAEHIERIQIKQQ